MKRLRLLALALAVLLQPVALRTATAQTPAQCDGCALIEEALKAAQGLTPGTPRSKVEVNFQQDGGLQSVPTPTRYVFKKCPMIKVEIEFTHFDGQHDEMPSDQVVKVSRPYLEYPFSD